MNAEVLEATEKETTEIVRVVQQANLEKADQQSILNVLGSAFNKISEYHEQASKIHVKDENDVQSMKVARELRLMVKKTRTEGENARKKLKEESLRKGQTIDAVWRIIKNGLEPIESELEEKEKTAERIAEQRKRELFEARLNELSQYNFDGSLYPLAEMPDDSYHQLIQSAIAAEEKRQAEIIAAEQARIEAERLEAERIERERLEAEKREKERQAELERLRLENERLEKERKEREQEERRKAAERDANRQKVARAIEKKLTSEGFTKSDFGLSHDESGLKISQSQYSEIDNKEQYEVFLSWVESQVEALKKAKQEAEKRAKLEAELAEAKRLEQERIEKEKKEDEARKKAEREARLAPDKVKLHLLADQLSAINLPAANSQEAEKVLNTVSDKIAELTNYIRQQAELL